MKYMKVSWFHIHQDYPYQIIMEVDEKSWERRKIEFFKDGRVSYAPPGDANNLTHLSIEPIPDERDIAKQEEFSVELISEEQFEEFWRKLDRITRT